ncbi:2',5'-phosphodiesterase 12-like [Anneissia japonica]|uniref:2',5'-phosphodiesterase 12-like n=1 Tax=Anneissia japonica TaxID=1529436 RepID=UPI0014259517|nr:2',5'-phosphodiesterase 12-like [Anneissia japonica]
MRAFFRRVFPRPPPDLLETFALNNRPKSPRTTLKDLKIFGCRVGLHLHTPMERVNVRCVEEGETMSILFVYAGMNLCLQRDKSEQVERALTRIRASVLKKTKVISKRTKKMKQDQNSSVSQNEQNLLVSLHNCFGKEIDQSLANIEAWINGAILNIGSVKYSVYRNSPTVTNIKLPRCAIVSCPVFPRLSLEFADDSLTKYVWYRGFSDSAGTCKSTDIIDNKCQEMKKRRSDDASEKCDNGMDVKVPIVSHWQEVGTSKVYTPTAMDEGSFLKLECTPSSGQNIGLASHCVLENAVLSVPTFPFEKRHGFTAKLTSTNSLRIVSYNILAEMYADSDFSRDVLYPYCPPELLDIDYREQVILKELTGYNADLICLQETGKKLFENALVPSLKTSGLDGLLCCKHGLPEGEAIFYRSSKLRVLESHDVVLCEAFKTDPLYADLLQGVSKNESMLKRVQSRSSIAQVVVFEEIANPSRKLCVANTHLYFHPRAGHVRLIQTAIIARYLENLKKTYKKQHGCENLAVIFCCDLNSTPGTGAYELLLTGSVSKKTADWYSSGKEEYCGGMALGQSLKLDHPYSSATYTNFVSGFQGVLDYIFYEPQYFNIEQEVPLPSHLDVVQFTALPSQVFPSDHLALVCDLKWNVG